MKDQHTHITLLNKKERFTFHLGDVILISALYVLMIILLYSIFDIEQSLDLNVALYSLIYLVYYLIFESIYASTPVKLKNARIVDMKGNQPSFFRVLLRTFCRFIPFDSVSFLFLKRGRGLHDILSGTQVVKKFKKR